MNRCQLLFVSLFLMPLSAYGLCVTASRAQLRSGPGTRYSISWVVGRYTPLVLLKQKGSWLQVEDQDHEKHWIYRPLVTQAYHCVAVKSQLVAPRTGPGRHFATSDSPWLDKYTPLKKLAQKGDWVQVEDAHRQKFWVQARQVWRPVRIVGVNF